MQGNEKITEHFSLLKRSGIYAALKELRKLEHWVPENHPLRNFNKENDKKKTSLKTMFSNNV